MTTSGNGGGRRNGGGGAAGSASGPVSSTIPATSRKIVQNLKEIVNCPEQEIYAMLKECNMDPSETVHRLLNQDTFHEVKSKREKKKEIKETTESRSRGVSNTTTRGGRGGSDRSGRIGSNQLSSKEYGVNRGKPVNKKEDGASNFPSPLILESGISGNSINRRPVPSDSIPMDITVKVTAEADGTSLSSQPSTGFQHAWLGVPGQLSMADIVKMGRPQAKAPCTPAADLSYPSHKEAVLTAVNLAAKHTHSTSAIVPSESHHELHTSEDSVSKVSEVINEPVVDEGQHISHDGWSLVDQLPAGCGSTVIETSDASTVYADPSTSSSLHVDRVSSLLLNSPSDEIQIIEGKISGESLAADSVRSVTSSDREIHLEHSGGEAGLVEGSFNNLSSFQSQRHTFECHEGQVEDVNAELSSATTNLQQLSLHKEKLCGTPADHNPAVIISNHLQVTNADCSHLSFGSFGSGISATFSGSFASKNLKSNLEVASVAADASSVDHSDARNLEYYTNEQLRSTSIENEAPRTNTNPGNLDTPSSSQPEVIRPDSTDAMHGLQYNEPSSIPGYAFSSTTQPSAAAYTFAQANSQMQNLAPFSSVMQAYSNSLPSNLLASTVQPGREFDVPYSPLLATQSMPTKYSTAVSSISGPTMSMPEAVKPGVLSTLQPTLQTLATTSIPTGPSLPQHLPVHPYSQPTLPLGHFANMISYPFLPQSYTYLPSAAFQQAYTGNSAYHQSPAAVHSAGMKYTLPEYKSSVSVNSLPQSAAVASAYGGFASSTNIPGSYALNPTSASGRTTIGYDDAISSQFKEGSHYVPLQQTENSAMWIHGNSSRTMSALPASAYYSFQGQNQQNSGFRQSQQPSHFGTLGYPNFYHSQEHQQNPSEGNLNGSQGPTSQPSHQMWQHSY